MSKVLVLGNIQADGLAILKAFADVTVLSEPANKSDIAKHIPEMDAVLHKIGKIDRDIMARQKKLRIIARHGVGLDYLDLDSIREHRVPVSITPNANSNAVAEATVGLMLSALRHFNRAETMIKRDRVWERERLMGRELRGSCVGLIGYGRIGRLVADYLSAFGCTIFVYDPDPRTVERCEHTVVDLNELLRSSDIISLHCPLTAQTRHLIDAEALGSVRRDCIIVNTSRGALIDTSALESAVREARISGAALDVFDSEPPDFNDPVFDCERIITTPHVAAMTAEAQKAMAVGAATEIRRVLFEGRPPSNDVLAVKEQA